MFLDGEIQCCEFFWKQVMLDGIFPPNIFLQAEKGGMCPWMWDGSFFFFFGLLLYGGFVWKKQF